MSSYQVLLNAAEAWADRPDLVSQAPDFVRLAEQRIARDVASAHQRVRETWTITSQEWLLPADWLSFISVPLNLYPPQKFYDDPCYTETGESLIYTIDGRYLVLAPFSGNVDLDVSYRARFPVFVDPGDTNTVLQENEELYLAAIRAIIADRAQDLELEAKLEARYQSLIKAVNHQTQWAQASGSAVAKR